jgi:ribonuclease P protein component
MQRRHRLTKSRSFAEIHKEGISRANRLLVLRVLPNGLDHSRFGFVVSKRIGNAVTRNLVKRRLREVVRQNRVKDGWDAVFIARSGIASAEFIQLKKAADNLLRRSQLFQTTSGHEQ